MMVILEKGFALRHIGHLDLMRTVQRALRRSGLPIMYSKGFSPHIELSFASPLGVGVVGMGEAMDVPLTEEVSEETFVSKLNAVLPSCMRAQRARLIPDEFPTLMALVAASRYTFRLAACEESQVILKKLPEFLGLADYQALRKTKSGESMCNIRPFVLQAEAAWEGEEPQIHCLLEATPKGTLKPSLFFKSLAEFAGVAPPAYVAIREEILCRLADGSLVKMEDYPHA